MASSSSSSSSSCLLVVVVASLLVVLSSAQLKTDYYEKTCPKVFSAVESVVESAVAKEKRMAASLVRLHFHDCFVQVRLVSLTLIYL